jgi:hypothetical protein
MHVSLAIKNCSFPENTKVIPIDSRGFVHGTGAPGVGFDIDWDAIEEDMSSEYRG